MKKQMEAKEKRKNETLTTCDAFLLADGY